LVKKYLDDLNITIPDDKLQKINSSLEEMAENHLQSLPMVCKGAQCIFAETCPLQQQGVAPIGELCPVERMLIDQWARAYAASLQIDTQNFVELSMLADIVEAEVYDRRTSGDLSLNMLFDMQAVGVDKNGDPILRKEPAVALEVKMMMKKRKDDIRRAFLATREVRAKYKQIESEDITAQFAKIRADIEAKAKQLPEPAGENLDFEDQESDWEGDPSSEESPKLSEDDYTGERYEYSSDDSEQDS